MPRPDPDPVVPIFEDLPVFEEEDLPPARPDPFVRALLDRDTPQGEELRLLAARLLALGRDRRLRRLGIVSAVRGEGRSTVALGLTHALAEEGRRVLLVELDLHHPAADTTLDYPPPAIGLRRFLRDDTLERVTVRRPGRRTFWVLSAGAWDPTGTGAPSRRLTPLLAAAERVFDYVVVDCPALLSGGGMLPLQDFVDGLVLVIRERRTSREALRRAARILKPHRLCGYVLNRCRVRPDQAET